MPSSRALRRVRRASTVLPWAAETPADPAEALGVLREINSVLAVAPIDLELAVPAASAEDAEVQAICRRIDEARAAKDFKTSDALRDQLIQAGYEVHIGRDGTTAERKLA